MSVIDRIIFTTGKIVRILTHPITDAIDFVTQVLAPTSTWDPEIDVATAAASAQARINGLGGAGTNVFGSGNGSDIRLTEFEAGTALINLLGLYQGDHQKAIDRLSGILYSTAVEQMYRDAHPELLNPYPPSTEPPLDPFEPETPSWLPGFGEGEKRTTSPIILDLDGDGVETTAVTAGAYFDHVADGFAEQTGWVCGGDGLLVRDIDGDGRIDSGRELFGNETLLADGVTKAANGFAALAVLDSNTDGKVDANDAAWQELKVWIDADGDGYSQTDELFTLEQVGVASVNTGFTTSTTVDANGNAHKQIGTFTRADGTTAAAEDVWFASNPTFSFAEEWVTVSAEIAVLPDAKGYGKVYDLHQAMARDTSGHLQTLVSGYVAATDNASRASLVEQILYAWTGTVSVTEMRGAFDGRKLAVNDNTIAEFARVA